MLLALQSLYPVLITATATSGQVEGSAAQGLSVITYLHDAVSAAKRIKAYAVSGSTQLVVQLSYEAVM